MNVALTNQNAHVRTDEERLFIEKLALAISNRR